MGQEKPNEPRRQAIAPAQVKQIQELAETIRYGTITLVFQDGILIQIEKVCVDKTKSGCGSTPTTPPIIRKSNIRIAVANRIEFMFFMLLCPPL